MVSTEITIMVAVAVVIIAIGVAAFVLTLPPSAPTTGTGTGGTINADTSVFDPLGSGVSANSPSSGSPPPLPP